MPPESKHSVSQSSLAKDLAQLLGEISKLRRSATFCAALDYLMKSRGITNDEMEERTGLCRDTISRYRSQPDKESPLQTVTLFCLGIAPRARVERRDDQTGGKGHPCSAMRHSLS